MSPDDPRDRDQEDRPDLAKPLLNLPILETEDELEDEDLEEGPRAVLVTGACGNIGKKLRAAWADTYDLVLLDAAADPHDPEVVKVDLSVLDDEWITHFHGMDTVIHLAANPDEFATWEELEKPNLDALCTALECS